ncbi:hypothetical protein KPSA3_00520 [Pseudomonas syringae pv. actinidiae]|uniref:Uncharacterized protein n=1 Tax=Pseudomonas syringae pv. actinidiae TaxID=103796 RepID=A0AAN4TIV4_PSESF|nr:hypothetical protein KPSA3_00520 [Pseudomonas syringae pv. actinidiae]
MADMSYFSAEDQFHLRRLAVKSIAFIYFTFPIIFRCFEPMLFPSIKRCTNRFNKFLGHVGLAIYDHSGN